MTATDEALVAVVVAGVDAGHAAAAVGAEVGPAVDRLVRSLERALGTIQAIPEVSVEPRLEADDALAIADAGRAAYPKIRDYWPMGNP